MNSIFQEQARFSVNMIDYHLLPVESNEETINVTISPVDSITVTRRSLKDIVLLSIRRSLKLEPVAVYALDVEVQILIGFEEGIDTSSMKDEEIIQAFKKSCGALIANVLSRVSILISTITSANGQMPVITQPVFIEPEQEK